MANIYAPPSSIEINLPDNLIDLFGRLRTSNPVIQLQVTQTKPITNLLITEGQVSGSGTSSTSSLTTASTTMSVTSGVNGLRRFRTRVAGLYQAGKSLLLLQTFNLLDTSGDISFVMRSSVSGVVTPLEIPQVDWNVDKFDGSGPSGIVLDKSKAHIIFFGFEWLGVGDVVCGFINNRELQMAHIFNHSNELTNVYIRCANLFPCYEIESASSVISKKVGYFDNGDGVFLKQTGGTGNQLRVICSSLLNEGDVDKKGTSYAISRVISTDYNTGTGGLARAILLFRLNPNYITSRVLVTGVEIVVDANVNYYLYLCRQPQFSGAVTPNWISLTNRSIQYDPNPNTTGVAVTNFNDSAIWISTYTANSTGAGSSNTNNNIDSIDYLGSDYTNTPEIWALVIACNLANAIITNAVIKFIEEV